MKPGVVLVVDGPSQVGVTTTVRELQRVWPQVRSGPLLEVGKDRAMAAFGSGTRRWSEVVLPHVSTSGTRAGNVAWGPMGRDMLYGMHRAAAAWAHSGFDVVVDHLLLDRATVVDLQAALEGLIVVHVGLICDPDVLEDREREAGGRSGLAVAELYTSRDVLVRDLELDTSAATTEELVEPVLIEVARRLRR